MSAAISELAPLIGVRRACRALGMTRSTYYRQHAQAAPARIRRSGRAHPRALSPDEQAAIRAHLNAERFVDCAPRTIYATLLDEGIRRPSISNDNPYSEAQFKTMKYGPSYPDRFASIGDARTWVASFIAWYNTEHRHSGIGFLTPQMMHNGQASRIVAARQQTLDVSYAAHPERFVRGRPTPPIVPEAVWINPPLPSSVSATAAATPAPVPTDEPGSRVSAAAAAP